MEHHKQGPYHHGQLRQALLDAAVQLITEQGIDRLTLREVARKAGVSHAAPYHHFADKSALIEAIVVDGFHTFAAALREAGDIPGSSLDRLVALGRAYVHFAVEHPATFRLMYRPELHHSFASEQQANTTSAIDEAAHESFQILVDTIASVQQEEDIPDNNTVLYALTEWSAVHGIATLWLDGSLSSLSLGEKGVESLDRLVDQVARILAEGLRVR